MLDYSKRLETAYNQLSAAVSSAARTMDKTKLKNKKAFTNFMDVGFQEGYLKLSGAVKTLSDLDYKTVGEKDRKQMLKNGEKQIKDFQGIKQTYLKGLDWALTTGIPLPDEANKLPVPLKVLAPDAYRFTKLLKTEVEAIAARAVQNWEQFDKEDQGNKILQQGKKVTDKIEDDTERKQAKEVANAKQALLTFGPKLKAAMAKGAAAVQKIKANPIPQTYNDEMNNAGRDVSQNIVNIEKWRNHPTVKEFKEVKAMPDPGTIAARIAAFGDGNRRSIDANATPQQVLAELKDYSAVLKDIAQVYSGVMSGSLASKLDR